MEHMMKVVLVDRPGEIQILERPIPRPNKGEALLKVKYCGICGSDVAVYRGINLSQHIRGFQDMNFQRKLFPFKITNWG